MKLLAERRLGLAALVAAIGLPLAMVAGPLEAHPAPQSDFDYEQGQRALNDARAHMAAGRWSSAAESYAEALRYLPGNEEAIAGLREAEALLNRGVTVQDVEQTTRVLAERARVEFDDAMGRARDLLGQEDFDGAMQVALTAQIRMGQARSPVFDSVTNGVPVKVTAAPAATTV